MSNFFSDYQSLQRDEAITEVVTREMASRRRDDAILAAHLIALAHTTARIADAIAVVGGSAAGTVNAELRAMTDVARAIARDCERMQHQLTTDAADAARIAQGART